NIVANIFGIGNRIF
ncbi:hypothetical protein D031_4683B, partial [Vibrio parahaemolyticus VP-48]